MRICCKIITFAEYLKMFQHVSDSRTLQPQRAAYYTLGCKLNFAETSTIGRLLEERGIHRAANGEAADLCIINTCSVTELADKKCRQTIRRIIRRHPGAAVIVTGCYAQLKPDDVAHIEGVDLVLGAEEKGKITEFLNRLHKRQGAGDIATTPSKEIRRFAPSCSRGDRTRYFLKVQDGCDYFCSYCTIPFARGRSRNGSIADLVRQAEEVVEEGGREIVLTGVNIGDFGRSTGESFYDLVGALDRVEGIARYRISSLEPDLLTDELIDFVAASQRFAPHFHIPLQSGSDEVLRLMRRRYDTALFADKIAHIRRVMPDAFIGVDLIVGMRGETDTFFDESATFVENLDLSQLHVFTYSERPGTQALRITPVVAQEVRHERCRRMLEISDKKLRRFYSSQMGKTRPVLFEHPAKGAPMHGFTDNYVRVELPFDKSLVNTVCDVKIGGFIEKNDIPTLQATLAI